MFRRTTGRRWCKVEEYVETLSGKRVKMSIIEEAAYDSLETIMSVLPEEAQTYDMILFVLNMAEEKLKGIRVRL